MTLKLIVLANIISMKFGEIEEFVNTMKVEV